MVGQTPGEWLVKFKGRNTSGAYNQNSFGDAGMSM